MRGERAACLKKCVSSHIAHMKETKAYFWESKHYGGNGNTPVYSTRDIAQKATSLLFSLLLEIRKKIVK